MVEKTLEQMTELELLEVQGQSYEILIRVRNDLQAINREIQRRKTAIEGEKTNGTGKS